MGLLRVKKKCPADLAPPIGVAMNLLFIQSRDRDGHRWALPPGSEMKPTALVTDP